MSSSRGVECTRKDPACVLCRELNDREMEAATSHEDTNFILRRAMPYVNRAVTKEWQEDDEDVEYEKRSTLEDKTRVAKEEFECKTVTYFGDTNRRKKNDTVIDYDTNNSAIESDDENNSKIIKNEEIIVNVSPSREDVLRIEEDETRLEDYWSLPGDTSGFKADWSFVQQWRLKG